MPRAIVMDQLVIDKYLMEGVITLAQYRSAEFLINMAARAGMWAKGIDTSDTYSDVPKKTKDMFRMMPLGDALSKIKRDCGSARYQAAKVVIFNDYDIRKRDGLRFFTEAMDYVANNIMLHHKNPLRHLE